ncbi:hypothetical protein NG798_03630 [Ancylothrix sp. C2]|uniref:hypothetical protein n=1 Tax=Ancylothrix sp. D3o TaxID=2953691 RepID=UPI0021BAAD3F|nr:hypothetical protein [Ancylothrix sp. D3o]MCT7948867.1 hypothetical protein [Ancylothrix sp. D3o]
MNHAMRKFIQAAGLIVAMSAVLMTQKVGPVQAKNYLQADAIIAQRRDNVEAQIDAYADRIFFERHPELAGSKIRPGETNLAREWQEIRRCEAVVDYIFYQRHPELAGRKIQRHETSLAQEWKNIYDNLRSCQ